MTSAKARFHVVKQQPRDERPWLCKNVLRGPGTTRACIRRGETIWWNKLSGGPHQVTCSLAAAADGRRKAGIYWTSHCGKKLDSLSHDWARRDCVEAENKQESGSSSAGMKGRLKLKLNLNKGAAVRGEKWFLFDFTGRTCSSALYVQKTWNHGQNKGFNDESAVTRWFSCSLIFTNIFEINYFCSYFCHLPGVTSSSFRRWLLWHFALVQVHSTGGPQLQIFRFRRDL